MKITNYVFCLTICLLMSCGSGAQSNENKEASAAKNESKDITCLTAIADTPCQIFDLNAMASMLNVQADVLEMREPPEMVKNSSSAYCRYTWKSDRTETLEMFGQSMTKPLDNLVEIGGFDVITNKDLEFFKNESAFEYFDKRHTTPTQEDKQKMDDAMEKKMQDSSDIQKKASKSIMASIPKFSYVDIQGVGDAARWQVTENKAQGILSILYSNMVFKIVSNASEDNDANLAVAKKIASEMLKRCD